MRESGADPARPKFSPSAPDQEMGSVTPSIPAAVSEVRMTKPGVSRMITHQELSEHSVQNPWFVVHGQVYDGTPYLDDHPGGADSILLVAGQDATEDFMAIHSADAKKKLAEVRIPSPIRLTFLTQARRHYSTTSARYQARSRAQQLSKIPIAATPTRRSSAPRPGSLPCSTRLSA